MSGILKTNVIQLQVLNGIISLENEILDVLDQVGEDVKLIIAGDFNARTGNECDYIECEDSEYIACGSYYSNDHFEGYRKSKDKVVNTFGHCLLDMCCNLNIHFVNGRIGKDINGEFTFMSAAGCSVIDYFIISSQLFIYVKDFEILYVDISDRFPLSYTMRLSSVESRTNMSKNHSDVRPWTRFKWGTNGERQFLQRLSCSLNGNFLGVFSTAVEEDTNIAAKMLTDCLHEAGRFLIKKSIFKVKQHENSSCGRKFKVMEGLIIYSLIISHKISG